MRSAYLVLAYMAFALVLVLVSSRCSRADEVTSLPNNITCDQVVHYAGEFSIPNTKAGRARAKIIAAALGFWLTDAELDAAARCLASRGVKR